MGFFDKLFNEFIDIIEWVDNSNDTIVWKFPRYQNEIKMGAKLTVREGQTAVFMNEGKIADIFGPGLYTLQTQNMPVMTTLQGWPYGFDSPFKADIYFISMRQFVNLKWGTRHPVMLRDTELGPVRLRAFGTYTFRVQDAGLFMREIVAGNPEVVVEDISTQLTNIAVSRGMAAIAEQRIPIMDLAAKYDEVSRIITERIKPEIAEIGLELTKFLIENVSLPPEVEEALDKRSSIGILGNLNDYTRLQAANALESAAENPAGGGIAAAGLGAGMGIAMIGQIDNMLRENNSKANTVVPPALPDTPAYFVGIDGKQEGPYGITQLQQMFVKGNFTKQSMVWKKGMINWATAETLPELVQIFLNTPPPLPNL